MAKWNIGAQLGKWELVECLGKGGNGEVWKVRQDRQFAAMKILTKEKVSAFNRFEAEIDIHEKHADVPGILPLIDFSLPPESQVDKHAWFVMPLATKFTRAVRYDFRDIVTAVISVAETLVTLHERGVVHRDLKPDNLLHYKGRPHVGDFGIADYPEKTSITRNNEQLGAYWTIAPEMERAPRDADGRKADVYSLAKSLWMLLTKDHRCFGGQYLPGRRPMALSSYFTKVPLLHIIENLLAASTAHEPDERPDMATFAQTLRDWADKAGDFREVSLGDWGAFQNYLFPVNVPQRATWLGIEDIAAVLNLLGANAELNHMFSPDGGGLDLEGAKFSSEPDCLELRFEGRMVVIVKPQALFFESFPRFSEWAYFRLETSELSPSGAYDKPAQTYEEVLELAPGDYRSRVLYDQGCIGYSENGEPIPLPRGARVVTRQFKGSWVVFAKASHFNEIDRYQGDHDKYGVEEFRHQIEKVVEKFGGKLRKRN